MHILGHFFEAQKEDAHNNAMRETLSWRKYIVDERIASAERKNQVRTVDRSERIRTYNFPENRLSDHRVNYKANNLDAVMNGDLEAVIQSLIDADRTSKLAAGNS